jgi:hypothetical protein
MKRYLIWRCLCCGTQYEREQEGEKDNYFELCTDTQLFKQVHQCHENKQGLMQVVGFRERGE